jgi:DNA-binding transcriptional MocR family regulator
MTTVGLLPVVEDDIYGDLHFGSERPRTIKTYDREGWILLCSSFSKTLAPGMRIGWTIPGRFLRKIQEIKFMTNIATSGIGQQVITRILEMGAYERFLKDYRIRIRQNVLLTQQLIQDHFPEGTRISDPSGGLVLWIELPADKDSVSIQQEAMEQQIGIAPGPIFSSRGLYRNYIRMNCGNVFDAATQLAVKKLGRLI